MNRTVFSIGSLFFLVAACLACGYLLGRPGGENEVAEQQTDKLSPELQELILKAETASRGTKLALATASIDGDIDVLFALDLESGNLFAWLPGPAGFLGEWQVNVSKSVDLEKGANPDLLLTVGNFNIRRGNSGALRDVPLICYVANGENGKVAGFGFQWNAQMAKSGTFQRGSLVQVYTGSTRQQTIKRQ